MKKLKLALLSLIGWFAPQGYDGRLGSAFFGGDGGALLNGVSTIAYALTIGFLEPFYVAAGFALYLNRRAELEAWDIEQEFRRAFGE